MITAATLKTITTTATAVMSFFICRVNAYKM
jgi:hypothetical protein